MWLTLNQLLLLIFPEDVNVSFVLLFQFLASESAEVLCILGSGAQARSHVEALKFVKPFTEVIIYNYYINMIYWTIFAVVNTISSGEVSSVYFGIDCSHIYFLHTYFTCIINVADT